MKVRAQKHIVDDNPNMQNTHSEVRTVFIYLLTLFVRLTLKGRRMNQGRGQ